MKKILALVTAVVLWGAVNSYGQGNKWNLRQCIDTGIARNMDVLQGDLAVQTADANLKMAKASRFPDLNASLGQGINQGRSIDPFTNGYINQSVTYGSYGLNSGVTLFNGFSIQNTIKQNNLIYQAAQKESQQAKDNLTIGIILAYLDVLKGEDQLSQSLNQVAVTQQQLDRLVTLDKNGAIPPSQLSDMKGQLAGDQLSVISGENALETARINLSRLMNINYDAHMQLERLPESGLLSVYADTPNVIYQAALEKFASVKAVDLRTQSAAAGLRVAKGQLYPTLSFNGNVNTNYSSVANQSVFLNTTDVVTQDYVTVNGSPSPVIHKQSNFTSKKIGYGSQIDNNLFTSFSLNLRVPIFNGWQGKNRVAQAKIDLKSNELFAQTTKTQLRQAIDQAYINMSTGSKQYKTLLEQVSAYKESFNAAEVRFNSGVGTIVDYMIAKNNLDKASISVISAKYDFMLRMKILDYYQGKLLW